ncbi:hypothetical protein GCM10027612_32580 [Microbispora bryophytorum subsp. camponoti]
MPDHKEAQQRHPRLAGDDHHGDPPRDLTEVGKAEQRGADQRLVRDRIGDLAEVGDQRVLPGEPAVELVGEGREQEDAEGRKAPALPSTNRKTMKTGTIASRAMVRTFAMFQVLTWRIAPSPVPSAAGTAATGGAAGSGVTSPGPATSTGGSPRSVMCLP